MKKKLKTSLGPIIVGNKHPFSTSSNTFRMSAYLQDIVCYTGQKETFEEGSETIEKLMGIAVSNKQLQTVSEHYGACLEKAIEEQIHQAEPQEPVKQDSQAVYGMCDGSMLFTRTEGWKEIKLGRVFKAEDNVFVSPKRKEIDASKYCSYLGSHEHFLERFDLLLNGFSTIIFIADGARWFWEWASVWYPQAKQILDYYHCKEYLCEFAKLVFKDQQQRTQWIKEQEDLLFEDKIVQVISNIKTRIGLNNEAMAYQEKIITYYTNNKTRMLYGTYKAEGLLIGSGPIESAHRNIIQKRLKLSGQRWGKPGAQQIANLRVVYKSNEWDKVIKMIKTKKMAA